MNEQQKKRAYNERTLQIKHSTFTPFVFPIFECVGRECKNIEIKPKPTPLTGEELDSKSANTTNKARLDIRARGAWERGEQAFLDF